MTSPLTLRELCDRWSCGRKPVEKMISDGTLHAFKVGSSWRIPWEGIAAHEAGQSDATVTSGLSTLEGHGSAPALKPARPTASKPKPLAQISREIGKRHRAAVR